MGCASSIDRDAPYNARSDERQVEGQTNTSPPTPPIQARHATPVKTPAAHTLMLAAQAPATHTQQQQQQQQQHIPSSAASTPQRQHPPPSSHATPIASSYHQAVASASSASPPPAAPAAPAVVEDESDNADRDMSLMPEQEDDEIEGTPQIEGQDTNRERMFNQQQHDDNNNANANDNDNCDDDHKEEEENHDNDDDNNDDNNNNDDENNDQDNNNNSNNINNNNNDDDNPENNDDNNNNEEDADSFAKRLYNHKVTAVYSCVIIDDLEPVIVATCHVSGSLDQKGGRVCLWQLDSGKLLHSFEVAINCPVAVCATTRTHHANNTFLCVGTRVAYGRNEEQTLKKHPDYVLRIYDVEAREQVHELGKGYITYAGAICLDEAQQLCMVSCNDHCVRAFDILKGEMMMEFHNHVKHAISALCCINVKHDKLLITASIDSCLKLWNAQFGMEITCLVKKSSQSIYKLLFNYKYNLIIGACGKKGLCAWKYDLDSTKLSYSIKAVQDDDDCEVRGLWLSQDDEYVVIGGDKFVSLHDAATGRLLHQFEVDNDCSGDNTIACVSVSRDGKYITVGMSNSGSGKATECFLQTFQALKFPTITEKFRAALPADSSSSAAATTTSTTSKTATTDNTYELPPDIVPLPLSIDHARPVSECAVSLSFLISLRDRLSSHPEWSSSDVVFKYVVPTTAKYKCRYTDVMEREDVGLPVYFVSHRWSDPFERLVERLESFCKKAMIPTSQRFFWLDLFAVSQHPGSSQMSDLNQLAEAIKSSKKGTLFLMDRHGEAFHRIWCLFELFITISHRSSLELAVDIPTDLDIDSFRHVWNTFDYRSGVATIDLDRRMIIEFINHAMSDVSDTKQLLNAKVREAIINSSENEMNHLIQQIDGTSITIETAMIYARHAQRLYVQGEWKRALGIINNSINHIRQLPDASRLFTTPPTFKVPNATSPYQPFVDNLNNMPENMRETVMNQMTGEQKRAILELLQPELFADKPVPVSLQLSSSDRRFLQQLLFIYDVYTSILCVCENWVIDEAFILAKHCLDIAILLYGENENIHTLKYIISQAHVWKCAMHYKQALPAYQRAIQITTSLIKQAEANQDRYTAEERVLLNKYMTNSLKECAEIHREFGEWKSAKQLLNQALSLYEADNQHPQIALIYTAFAQMEIDSDRIASSHEYLQKSLAILKQHNPSSSPSTSINFYVCYVPIGRVYAHMCKYDDALQWYTRSLKFLFSVYGDHAHRSISENYLAICQLLLSLTRSNTYPVKLYGEDLLNVTWQCCTKLWRIHGDMEIRSFYDRRMHSYQCMCDRITNIDVHMVRDDASKLNEAVEQSLQYIKFLEEQIFHNNTMSNYDVNNPFLAQHLYEHAKLLLHPLVGQYSVALQIIQRALKLRRETFTNDVNNNHSKGLCIADSLVQLGDWYLETDRIDDALPLFEEALTIRDTVFAAGSGTNQQNVNNCCRWSVEAQIGIARCLLKQDDQQEYKRANQLLMQAMQILNQVYALDGNGYPPSAASAAASNNKPPHIPFQSVGPSLLDCYSTLAFSYKKLGQHDKAAQNYKLVDELKVKIKNHEKVKNDQLDTQLKSFLQYIEENISFD